MRLAGLLRFTRVPPAWIVPSILLGWLAHRYIPVLELLATPWNAVAAAVALIASLYITGRSARGLARHDTTIYPHGESTTLVIDGMYRYSRNPMYVGMALLVLSASLLMGSLSALLAVPFFCLMVERYFIRPEEARLEGWFGDQYREYCRRVRRWI